MEIIVMHRGGPENAEPAPITDKDGAVRTFASFDEAKKEAQRIFEANRVHGDPRRHHYWPACQNWESPNVNDPELTGEPIEIACPLCGEENVVSEQELDAPTALYGEVYESNSYGISCGNCYQRTGRTSLGLKVQGDVFVVVED